MTVQTLAKIFSNLVYPAHCYICKKGLEALTGSGLCDFCRSRIRRNPKPCCRKTLFSFERSYSACLYEGVLKELIHLFKYNGKMPIGRILSGLVIDYVKDSGEILDGVDMITFVPLDNSRLRRRGFNQSRILAFNISKEFDVNFADCLEKPARTRHQNELSREQRLVNLDGAFRIKKNASVYGMRILIADDVMTTGATLNECAKTLVDGGAKSVRCITLARGM